MKTLAVTETNPHLDCLRVSIAPQCLVLPPVPGSRGILPGLAVDPRTWALPSSSVSEAKTVFAKGSADFLGDFPESRWTTVFPEAGRSTEFTVLLAVLVFAYRVWEG